MLLPKSIVLARNIAVAFLNGLLTLIILLIAPLGLLAVITNTVLVTLSTYILLSFSDGILRQMFASNQVKEINQTQVPVKRWLDEQISPKRRDDE
jgi:hypothetical protein